MTVDKRISYEMQGGKKPARNYLGKQKTVSNVPVKWKSGPDAPETELAYITKAEKDLLLKKNLHGSLKNGPNTGPDDIMSLDSQGDYTADRSPAGRAGRSRQGQAQHEQHMKEILTGQKNIGQTTKVGPKTKKYAVPEYVKVKQPGGGYKDKYIGSGYKSYGTPSFFGNLFSRGAPGYRGIKGMPAFWGKPGFEFKQGPDGMGYYSDKENFGEIRDAIPSFGIIGALQSLANKFRKPKDMSEFNNLQLVDGELVDTRNIESKNIPVPGESAWSDGTFTWGGTTPPASKQYYGIGPVPPSDPFANPIGPRPVNIPGPYETAADDYWSDKQIINTPGGEIVIDSEGNEVVDMPTAPMGTPWDNPYNVMEGSVLDAQPQKGIMESISDWVSSFKQPETIVEDNVPVSNYDVRPDFYPGNKFTKTITETGKPMVIEEGVWAPKPGEWGYQGPLRLANGGLASLFTRRG